MKHQLAKWMSYLESVIIALPLCKISWLYLLYLKSYTLFFVAATFFGDTLYIFILFFFNYNKKVQVGKDQEKAKSERDPHSKNRGGKKTN